MKNARQIASEILNRIQKDNSYSNLILDSYLSKSSINQVDRAFVSALVYGVIERKKTLDFEISNYLRQSLKKLKPEVLTLLRLGAYQLLFMEKIPHSAAINESVKLAKISGLSFASGLINAVLRKISVNGLTYTDDLTIKYSVESWLCDKWINDYGEENTIKLLEESFGASDVAVRVNTIKTNLDELKKILYDEGFYSVGSEVVPNALIIEGNGPLHKTKAYADGLFHIQDIASQLCCSALDVKEGDTVLDICAAPGGKSFTIAQLMNNKGRLISMDIYPQRLDLLNQGAKRLGITNIKTIVNDGSVFNDSMPLADKILCDVPCAGLGVIRKKPEIRYKDSAEVDKLPDLQYSILCESSKYLKNNGKLIYSTCSLNKEENEYVIEKFLREHNNFVSEQVLSTLERHDENTDYISLMPHLHHCDGFFIAAIRKIKDV